MTSPGSLEKHTNLCREIVLTVSQRRLGIAWINETGAAYRDNRLIRYGLIGSSDIIVVLKNGPVVFIEVKTGSAIQSVVQKNFETIIKSLGHHYFVARSLDAALYYLAEQVATSRNV